MKLSTLRAKLTCSKSTIVRTFATLTLAGAALAFAAPASAQHFAVGVQFGGPRYFPPPPPVYGYGYGYDRQRFDAWRAHQAWERHEEWERQENWRLHHQPYPYYNAPRGYGYRPY